MVVFEKVYADETEVAAHEDLEDDGQTVKYKIGKVTVDMPDKPGEGQGSPPVKTGDALGGEWLPFVRKPWLHGCDRSCSSLPQEEKGNTG